MKWLLILINAEFFFQFVLWILQKRGEISLRMLIVDMGGNGRTLEALEFTAKI
jgi:hypothetical protein